MNSAAWKSRCVFLAGLAGWTALAFVGAGADGRPASGDAATASGEWTDALLPHVRFAVDVETALRNEDRGELAAVLKRIAESGGFPAWMLEYGRILLDSCPRGAILFTGSMIDTDSARYWQAVNGTRRDVAVLPMGYLDRSWFLDGMAREYNLRQAPPENGFIPDDPESVRSGGYSNRVFSEFYRILRSNVGSRPVCLSMDLSPFFLNALLPVLSVRGAAFEYRSSGSDAGSADPVTGRLLLRKEGFPALAAAGRGIAELDSLRRHYRYAAVDFMRRSGDRLDPDQKRRLLSLIHGPFSTFVLEPPVPETPAARGAEPES
jgi:hypothetical protein